MAPELPGFYYGIVVQNPSAPCVAVLKSTDEAKKKYFKITKNHAAPSSSSGAAYSAESVKRRKLDEEAAAEAARRQERRKKLTTRSRALLNPMMGGILAREYGYKMDRRTKSAAAVHGWEPKERFVSEKVWNLSVEGQRQFESFNGPEKPRDTTGSLSAFDYDAENNMCFLPKCADQVTLTSVSCCSRMGETPLMIADSSISSVNFDQESRMLISTWRYPLRSHNVFMKKIDTEFPNTTYPAMTLQILGDKGVRTEVLTSATAPAGSKYSFAIGTSDSIVTVGRSDLSIEFKRFPKREDNGNHSIFAVEFLCKQPDIILAGQRSGHITIIDTRLPFPSLGNTKQDFRHPSSVTHIKSIDEYRLVVAGTKSTLCQYDLRFSKKDRPHTSWHNSSLSQHSRESKTQRTTVPILTYPEHDNVAYLDLGLAVYAEGGLLAAAQSSLGHTVKVFSLHGGDVVRTLDAESEGSSTDLAPCRALRFVDDTQGRQLKSLWVAKGTKIMRYGH